VNYPRRRQSLRARLGPRSAALLQNPPVRFRNADTAWRYRADSQVLYLSGMHEEEGALLILPEGSVGLEGEAVDFVVFVAPKDPERERWTGQRMGVDGALTHFEAGAAYPLEQLEEVLAHFAVDLEALWFPFSGEVDLFPLVRRVLGKVRQRRLKPIGGPVTLGDLAFPLAALRCVKDDEELAALRRSAAVTAAGMRAGAAVIRPGVREREVEAAIGAAFRCGGAEALAFETIVGAGPHSAVLHHASGERVIAAGDVVLIDAGAEVGGYAGDITRTYPADGVFTEAQRTIYALVLAAQEAAIAQAVAGASFRAPHEAARRVLAQGLLELGFLRGSLEEVLEQEQERAFFMHGTSHFLGLDAHDVGEVFRREGGAPVTLSAGMVISVEPGLYFAADDTRVPEAYRGFGVRIEDMVAIHAAGNEVLSAALPKGLEEVERR